VKTAHNEPRWFLTALWFLFITLKLTGHVQWSWWWVHAPFWMPACLAAALWLVFFAMKAVQLWGRR
jgi:hypothetical protein